jgi:hypothetical protein
MEDYLTGRLLSASTSPVAAPAEFSAFAPASAPGSMPVPGTALAAVAASVAAKCATNGTGPKLELQEVDGRIARIIVTCGCGERTAIDCVYDR